MHRERGTKVGGDPRGDKILEMKRMIRTCRQAGYQRALPRARLEDDTTTGPFVTLLVPEYKGPMS